MPDLETALQTFSDERTAPGPDGITYEGALSNLRSKGTILLLQLFNRVWQQERLPQDWKLAKVVPLLKPGKSPMSLESFRPVSLTSCIGKVMKKLINERLQWWVEENNALSSHLARLRRRRCTMDCILNLVTHVEHERSRGNITVAVFLVLKGALTRLIIVTFYMDFLNSVFSVAPCVG